MVKQHVLSGSRALIGFVAICCAGFCFLSSTANCGETADSQRTAGTGLVAHYYRDHRNWGGTWPDQGDITGDPKKWTFTQYSYTRVEPVINHLFIRSGWFSVRWKGALDISAHGPTGANKDAELGEQYTFYIWADDGCRLFIDGQPLIESWQPTWEKSPEALRKATMRLKPGKHAIVIEYFQGSSLEQDDKDPIKLYWECKSQKLPKQIIPASKFSHDKDDYAAEAGKVTETKHGSK